MTTRTIDPQTLHGFVEYRGVRLTAMGDDGDVLLAIGHPADQTAVKAMRTFLIADCGWARGDVADLGTIAEVAQLLYRRWAAVVTDCGECGGGEGCAMCATIRSHDWWLDYSATEPVEGGFPVTILYLDC